MTGCTHCGGSVFLDDDRIAPRWVCRACARSIELTPLGELLDIYRPTGLIHKLDKQILALDAEGANAHDIVTKLHCSWQQVARVLKWGV